MKWYEIIKQLIADSTLDRNSLVLLTDIGFQIGKFTESIKVELLAILEVTTYDISALIDNILLIYEASETLDEDMVNYALKKYVRLNVITAEKRTQILSQLVKK